MKKVRSNVMLVLSNVIIESLNMREKKNPLNVTIEPLNMRKKKPTECDKSTITYDVVLSNVTMDHQIGEKK